MRRIVVTTPTVSVKRLYQGRRFLTMEGKETKQAIAWEVRPQWHETVTAFDFEPA